MPTKFCSNTDKLIAQTMFLGASVASFNVSTGWGGQPSQLTVNLIEDDFDPECSANGSALYSQFAGGSTTNPILATFDDNHYHSCGGIDYIECYVDKYTGNIATVNTPVENRILPGKVFYELTQSGGLVSKYWSGPDPGFFGRSTRYKEDGTYNSNPAHPQYKYDIIDTPVYFKMGDFTFGGFVQSWSRNVGQGGKSYTVIINSAQSILNSCYVIVDKYSGSIYSKSKVASISNYGSPKNYILSAGVDYNYTDIYGGAFANVFNVYGFQESLGPGNFGIAQNNEMGMIANNALQSLMLLTSITHDSTTKLDSEITDRKDHATKRAFSSFGRIISKTLQREDHYSTRYGNSQNNLFEPITSAFNKFGVISPQVLENMENNLNPNNVPRCQFVLDLNELLYTDRERTKFRMPNSVRLSGPILTIGDIINQIADVTGQDIFVEMVPVVHTGKLYNVIKVKAISRLTQPSTNIIENTINNLQCNKYNISSTTIGKEKNETSSRAMIVGGSQQRLLQVKSYRLAYSQNNFIFNPRTRKFINYYSMPNPIDGQNPPTFPNNQYGYGKIRFPNFNSSRNHFTSDYIGTQNSIQAEYKSIINDENKIQENIGNKFETPDNIWKTNAELTDGVPTNYGNYEPCRKFTHGNLSDTSYQGRWFPLHLDTICPFFGFEYDNEVLIKTEGTETRRIRPVWFDTWTGQIAVSIGVDELPQLNCVLTRLALESGASFPIPYTYTPTAPEANTVFNSLGPITAYPSIEYFILTESEIRAALAGFDNFLVYSLAKTYKPDLIEMVRRAYFIQTRDRLKVAGMTDADAIKTAEQETDWYWKLLGSNIGGDELYPTIIYPDKTDGSQYIQEKALQDLKIIHKFIKDIGKYYGKKYMVQAPYLRGYRDEAYGSIGFPTNIGYGYVFSGTGKFTYNYTPTNDGAWEEYGNVIDDAIVVGGSYWYALTGETGKIKPLLGYNNNYNFDYVRQSKCLASNNTYFNNLKLLEANPYFSYSNWLTIYENKTTNCPDSFIFPSLNLAELGNTEYVVVDQKYVGSPTPLTTPPSLVISTTPIRLDTVVKAYDAWGKKIVQVNGTTVTDLPRSKVYIPTSVNEDYIFLDTQKLNGARFLIDSPGVSLNVSSEENSKDPNRTVLSNVAAEDLLIYLKTNQNWDWIWIEYMLNYICPVSMYDDTNPYFLGVYTVSANSTAQNVELAPKAAHPFFAGIPIKSNQFTYGPWTNYPLVTYSDIYPTINNVPPGRCTLTSHTPTRIEAAKAIDNLITNATIEVNDDFVPWNYGGMDYLDIAAIKELETKVNYQAILETAQLEMPGLPIFNLGGDFIYNNINLTPKDSNETLFGNYSYNTSGIIVYDAKDTQPLVDLSYFPGATIAYTPPTSNRQTANYKIIDLRYGGNYEFGPIVTNIQCSMGQQGISTTYSFRTYTRKLGLFNRESIYSSKRAALQNIKANQKIAKISQEVNNLSISQQQFIVDERLNKSQFGISDFASKLFGWSPGTVLVGQAHPFIDEPNRLPGYFEDFTIASSPGGFNARVSTPTGWVMVSGEDLGDKNTDKIGSLTVNTSPTALKQSARISCTVQLFERKEVEGQIQKDYGMQSMMSLDGLLSPISFYPTFKNSTFSYSLHNTANCPFCKGSKVRGITVSQYAAAGTKSTANINITCDKCGHAGQKLNAKIVPDSDIPINLITLNPIVVPYGEFRNSNIQNYSGVHPEQKHDDISSLSPGYGGKIRTFVDRSRHCIEIVGRGSIPQGRMGYKLETSRNLSAYNDHPNSVPKNNLDYYAYDQQLYDVRNKAGDSTNLLHENNQRFFGLRGPLTLHSWGYDDDGYPVPNASDEPLAYDIYGRPKRFKLKITYNSTAKKFSSLSIGDLFQLTSGGTYPVYAKTFNNENIPSSVNNNTNVFFVTAEDNYDVDGGFDPGTASDFTQGYKGSIISKTQKFVNNKWSEKVKLNEFYLNWAERPDLWKVGPIDLFWDKNRMVWTAGGAEEIDPPYIISNTNDVSSLKSFVEKKSNNNKYIYRMIYVTLEEDLIKQPDFDETYVTRGYIDDIEFSSEPLRQGYRRLIYIKDKTGYCAPRGTKLLCRYNKKTGFYEPVSKPSLVVKGKTTSANEALIDMHYVQGRRSGVVPTMTVNFDNPLGFTVTTNAIAIFTFLNGKWTLTAIK